ncbi:hypothetical protein D3C85_1558890 [compost metagenome]
MLDQIAREEFKGLALGDLRAKSVVQVPPEQGGESQRQAAPGDDPGQRLADGHAMRLASTKHEKVQRQHADDEGDEAGPHPGFADVHGGHAIIPD